MDSFRRGSACVLLLFMLCMVASVAYARAQDLERRVDNLEAVQADRRLSIMETRIDTIDGVGKGILVVVATQLILQAFGLKRRGGS